MKTRSIIFCHKEDLDGICSAAILLHGLKSQNYAIKTIQLKLVNYWEFDQELEKILPEIASHNLFIADLGLNEDVANVIRKFPMPQSGRSWQYFDHHNIPKQTAGMQEKLKSLFTLYENAIFNANYIHKPICTAELLLFHFRLQKSDHFGFLAKLAHYMDYPKEFRDDKEDLAGKLKNYINYHQQNSNKLSELAFNLSEPEQWQPFLNTLRKETPEIEKWIQIQHEYIDKHLKTYEIQNYTVITAVADIRAGDITQYLEEKYPSKQIYLGLSRVEKYMNIRMKFGVADQIGAYFRGGGHENRAGFKIPKEISTIYEKSPNLESIPEYFVMKIMELFRTFMHKASP